MNESETKDVTNLSKILTASHANKWVAIAPDYSKIISADDSLRDLMHHVTDEKAIYHRVLPLNASFAPATI